MLKVFVLMFSFLSIATTVFLMRWITLEHAIQAPQMAVVEHVWQANNEMCILWACSEDTPFMAQVETLKNHEEIELQISDVQFSSLHPGDQVHIDWNGTSLIDHHMPEITEISPKDTQSVDLGVGL